jgi:3-dehydroquinate synthetase
MILSGASQRNPTNATGCVQKSHVWKVARRNTVIATLMSTIALDREIRWNNPDPPYEEYRYPYYLRSGPDAWSELLAKLRALATDRFVIVTDGAFPVHLAQAAREKISSIAPCTLLTFQGSEQAKNLLTVSQLGNEALRAGAIRSSVVIGLGGGLAGNVAGLLAGLFLRGARLVHVPTTLLAMSDSCLSLKQGVNSELGKNHFGLFKQPAFVWADLAYLRELPPREMQSALCELIKNVLALCPHRYDEVAAALRPDGMYAMVQIVRFIERCIEAKCSVMRDDALEKHGAVVLEYGHTVGHALEMAAHGAIPHGLAVGMGMMVAARISHRLGMLAQRDVDAHLDLLQRNGVPTRVPALYGSEELLFLMSKDNKRGYLPPLPGTYDLVLLKQLGVPNTTGKTVLTQVDEPIVRAVLETSRI